MSKLYFYQKNRIKVLNYPQKENIKNKKHRPKLSPKKFEPQKMIAETDSNQETQVSSILSQDFQEIKNHKASMKKSSFMEKISGMKVKNKSEQEKEFEKMKKEIDQINIDDICKKNITAIDSDELKNEFEKKSPELRNSNNEEEDEQQYQITDYSSNESSNFGSPQFVWLLIQFRISLLF
ncbi:hypothetical protein IMG5_153620 [Ichthyophthirius multifiliis]|uniref:Uncharacterized protein n=1 Tax=Ichthyophthirius multifiliis TaxID=5932 RepID=G0QZ10_ICHMU|nr:hypothetical protein IMG5_153620 [Ichthyophthirius multifiliis]EGR29545.1 hypothetical protein IMG5_153620 [Ichthyophthirius multifiliis]|eukprot:XP_004030781.1 hypothetical protein IMG5_153620 [Ichthyophthirius multifiliis]